MHSSEARFIDLFRLPRPPQWWFRERRWAVFTLPNLPRAPPLTGEDNALGPQKLLGIPPVRQNKGIIVRWKSRKKSVVKLSRQVAWDDFGRGRLGGRSKGREGPTRDMRFLWMEPGHGMKTALLNALNSQIVINL